MQQKTRLVTAGQNSTAAQLTQVFMIIFTDLQWSFCNQSTLECNVRSGRGGLYVCLCVHASDPQLLKANADCGVNVWTVLFFAQACITLCWRMSGFQPPYHHTRTHTHTLRRTNVQSIPAESWQRCLDGHRGACQSGVVRPTQTPGELCRWEVGESSIDFVFVLQQLHTL